jgi:hypothetical protein
MNEVEKINVRKAGEWLAGEIEIRVPKMWLAIGGVALAARLLVALD